MKNRLKKLLILLGLFIIILPAYGHGEGVSSMNIYVNNNLLESKAIYTEDSQIALPARGVLTHLGYNVRWDKATNTSFYEKDGVEYAVKVGSKTIKSNKGEIINLYIPIFVKNGTTYIGFRGIEMMTKDYYNGAYEYDKEGNQFTLVDIKTRQSIGKDIPKEYGKEVDRNKIKSKDIVRFQYRHIYKDIPAGSWEIRDGDVWVESAGTKYIYDVLINGYIGNYYMGSDKLTNDGEEISFEKSGNWINFSDLIRKSGGKAVIKGNTLVMEEHIDHASMDKRIGQHVEDIIKTSRADAKHEVEIAHIPKEEKGERLGKMVYKDTPPADVGFKFIEIRDWNNGKLTGLKDIKYVMINPGNGNLAPRLLKSTGPLKAGDFYAIANDNNSPNMGWVKGYYVFQIPKEAIPIHSSGDMRYGWIDPRMEAYNMKWVNSMRLNESDYMLDQGERIPSIEKTYEMEKQQKEFHKKNIVNTYGIKPVVYGWHGHGITPHFEGEHLGIEVISHNNRNLSRFYRDDKGQWFKSDAFYTLNSSGAHKGIMMEPEFRAMTSMNIYRPDMTEFLVMVFKSN